MLAEAAAWREALVRARPTPEQVRHIHNTLADLREMLAGQEVPEQERWYGRGEMGGSQTQLLLPPLIIDHVDDATLRAHFTAGESFMGLNKAMHGGIISALFDAGLGRLSMGMQRDISRTAYLTTQYRSVTPVNERLDMTGRVTLHDGRKKFVEAQLWHGDTLCAEAEALFIQVRPGHG